MGTILAILGFIVAFWGVIFATLACSEVNTFAEDMHKYYPD